MLGRRYEGGTNVCVRLCLFLLQNTKIPPTPPPHKHDVRVLRLTRSLGGHAAGESQASFGDSGGCIIDRRRRHRQTPPLRAAGERHGTAQRRPGKVRVACVPGIRDDGGSVVDDVGRRLGRGCCGRRRRLRPPRELGDSEVLYVRVYGHGFRVIDDLSDLGSDAGIHPWYMWLSSPTIAAVDYVPFPIFSGAAAEELRGHFETEFLTPARIADVCFPGDLGR